MHRFVLILIVFLSGCQKSNIESTNPERSNTELLTTERFEFEVAGSTLVGLFDTPTNQPPVSTIILVHGYGETRVVEQNWFYELRSKFASIGINTLVWDKPGCGESEGTFDINQPVQSSAEEVIAAVQALQSRQLPGTETIGVWGISRAGWIAPLAMQSNENIDYWISVSGTDNKENGRYLIESNLRIEGRTEAEVEQLVSEWQASFNTAWQNGTYQEYLDATPNFSKDDFIQYMGWGNYATEDQFLAYQAQFQSGALTVDEEDELMIYVPEFSNLLSAINRPVLALFGEKDTNVDWRKTAQLYRETIGSNPAASLTIQTFPNGNHTLRQSKTGGIREFQGQAGNPPYVEGYYTTMLDWLVANGFGANPTLN